MMINALLNALARTYGLSSLALDTHGVCAIEFNNGVHVDLHHNAQADVLCMAADVASLQRPDRDQIVSWLLRANLDTRPLRDAYFARRGAAVTLCRTLELEGLSADRLAGELSQLVSICSEWRQQIDARSQSVG